MMGYLTAVKCCLESQSTAGQSAEAQQELQNHTENMKGVSWNS